MPDQQDANVVTLSARGSATAPYDQVFFKTTVTGYGETGPRAKAEMQVSAAQLLGYVDSLLDLGKVKNKVALLKVSPHSTYSNHETRPAGYKASLDVSFMTDQPNLAAEIQDRLTEVNQSRVDSLTFGVSGIEELRQKAVEDAWEAVTSRFQHTAMTFLGSAYNWDVSNWEVNYDEHRPVGKLSAPTEETGGQATIQVTLTVTWRKNQ